MKEFPSPHGDIYLGSLEPGLNNVIQNLSPSSIFLITDENTGKYCVPLVSREIGSHPAVMVQPGEQHKNLESCKLAWSFLLKEGADRDSLVLNVGGGMICDLGGFAASSYQRGISFGHIPTSLLAMADASIGGKTGVNFESYKNYIGGIDPPAFVWIDPVFLKTLPANELRGGFAEIVKHAIIASRDLWDKISDLEDLERSDWLELLEFNTPIKQHIIEADLHEQGLRKVLNFGHTIGHALESQFMHFSNPLHHGDAVTLGMLCESRIAHEMGLLPSEDFYSIIDLIHRLLLPASVPLPSFETLNRWIQGDKKKKQGQVGFSLPDRIGSCGWNIAVENTLLIESLEWLSTQVKATSDRLNVKS